MTDTINRLRGIVSIGNVTMTDDAGNVQFTQVRFSDVEMKDTTPTSFFYGFSSRALPDAKALCLSYNGDRSNTYVVSTHDARYRPLNLSEGDTVLYNDLGMRITLGREGIILDAGGKTVTVNNASLTTVNGNAKIVGNLDVTGTITGTTIKQGSVNLGTHTHKENGTGGGITSAPNS